VDDAARRLAGALMPKQERPGFADDPLWYKDAVIYQVHVKSFFDANDDGIGDFKGLTQKLDYVKSLGATCIWLLPFYPSPLRDDGYDIADYRNVNPAYGTMADFRLFVKEAHARGIRVVTELVVNHTSEQHPWFQRARRAKKGSVWRNFYVWSDDDKKYSGARIIFTDTETSNWEWDPLAEQYYWHRFFSHQPDLNYDNPRVIEAVLNVMRFWLDAGVDGMRLDAVPYLCEREGTDCENLPETHGVLKILRAVLDDEYPGKVFLAEANQWPEDVRSYFGDGDECQMAFHFPLMPRMFMAIAEEDRYPIVDIMRQTPEIPESCQWAIFLRNHDEMTLEMVTERERDNMYRIYATEPRAKINVGIRRRLAPLMQNDRRRIELLTSLLLSMPGTPVIYYGDEIGMGDNIYLGDRDGVRTPMQWSVDRNGGFSRCDPARMFLPPIQDPVYGYQSVNVESQGRSPSSAINWMKRLISVRQGYKAFGRGTLRFLLPENRKVIAYVREYKDERILCVANLSRASQQVALDLSAFRGRVPVEMVGWSAFRTIGDDRYLLSLPGHGFFWFLLSETAQAPSWEGSRPSRLPELITLVLPRAGVAVSDAVQAKALALLHNDVLPVYLPTQRWFGEKGRRVIRAEAVDATQLDGNRDAYFAIYEVELEGTAGGRHGDRRYFLPLAIEESSDETAVDARLTVSRVRRGATTGLLTDATAVAEVMLRTVDDLRARKRYTTENGVFVFAGTDALDVLPFEKHGSARRLNVEQSNTSVVVGERLMLKFYRHVHRGAQPELEIARFFDTVGFENTPALLGSIEYTDADGATTALAIAQAYVESQGDGWSVTLAYLERFFDARKSMETPRDVAAPADGFDGTSAIDDHEIYLKRIRRLGERTAEMHRAFATSTGDPAFEPEPIAQSDFDRWSANARESATRALATLERELGRIPDEVRDYASSLLERRDAILERLTIPPLAPGEALTKTRFHGDYHLGQVLAVADDFMLVDFEGEPAREIEQRRLKSSPLRDVAGMLRSLNYAAVAALRGSSHDRAEDTSALAPLAAEWERRSIESFMAGYEETMAGASSYPSSQRRAEQILDLFVLEKAFYEMSYEIANRPSWVRIPLEGIRRILDGDPQLVMAGD